MLQRWSLELSAYTYDIKHRPGKQIPQADYLSRYAYHEEPEIETVLLTNPLPVDRNILIKETKLVYGPIMSALRNGWSLTANKRLPVIHAQRDVLTMTADGIILHNEMVLIPPSCREVLLQHLHSGHLGRDKMKSLSRLLCWWPSINQDIANYAQQYEKCKSKPRNHCNWKSPGPFLTHQCSAFTQTIAARFKGNIMHL